MADKPEQSFSVSLGDAELNITGREYSNLPTATIELRTGGIGKTEIKTPTRQAKTLVKKHLEHHPNPMKHQTDEARAIAKAWANQ